MADVLKIILNITWLHAHQIMVIYPVNDMFLCLGSGGSIASTPFVNTSGEWYLES